MRICPSAVDRRHLLAILSDTGPELRTALLFQRAAHEGPFEQEHVDFGRGLEPHLRRAANIQRRISAPSKTEIGLKAALDLLATGVMFLDGAGRVLHLNQSAVEMTAQDDGIGFSSNGLKAWGRAGTERLRTLVNRTIATRIPATMFLGRPSAKRPYTVLVKALPEPPSEAAYWAPSAVLFIVDCAHDTPSLAEPIASLYRLTPAEIRIVTGLIDGANLGAIATRFGIAKDTARGYLKHILHKTGTSRQGELIRLLLVTLAGLRSDYLGEE